MSGALRFCVRSHASPPALQRGEPRVLERPGHHHLRALVPGAHVPDQEGGRRADGGHGRRVLQAPSPGEGEPRPPGSGRAPPRAPEWYSQSSQAAPHGPPVPTGREGTSPLAAPLCPHRPGGVPGVRKKGNTSLLSQPAAQSRHSYPGGVQGLQCAATIPTGGVDSSASFLPLSPRWSLCGAGWAQ